MFDIITVGSATEDVFIRTKNPEILKKNSLHEVCYPIGTKIIVDDIHFCTGGGGTNSAVSFSRLGLKTAYLGKIGNDKSAREILNELKAENVSFIGKSEKGNTGYSVILIGLEEDRTVLTYKGMADDLKSGDVGWEKLKTKWFYFSSMLGESFETLKKLAQFARKNKIKYTFNPSTYLAKKGTEYLKEITAGCDILVVNREEAQLLAGSGSINQLLRKLQESAKIAIITDGKNGAYAYNGIKKYTVIPRKLDVVETTGAGDAFASGVTAGIIKGKSIEDSLRLGQFNAESVIRSIGAKNRLLKNREAEGLLRTKHIRIEEEAI
jgi:ribokinase